MPTRMSSVSAHLPMFGVSSVVFHGIAERHIGVPSTAACEPPGPKMMTSYLSRSFAVLPTVCGSM